MQQEEGKARVVMHTVRAQFQYTACQQQLAKRPAPLYADHEPL